MRRILLLSRRAPSRVIPSEIYLLRDLFTSPVAPGGLNGTAAEPGPDTRVAVDTAAGGGITAYYGNIIFDGNSLTSGFGLASPTTQNYVAQLMALLPTIAACDWQNNGLAGQNTLAMGWRASICLMPELAAGALTSGLLYKITAAQTDYFYPGCAAGQVFMANLTTALDANNKVQEIRRNDDEKWSGNLTIGNWYRVSRTEVNHFHTSGGFAVAGELFQATATDACDGNNKVMPIVAAPNTYRTADLRFSSLYAPNNICVAWEVGNDMAAAPQGSAFSAAVAVQNFWDYCDARRAVGYKVIALTVPPRISAGFNTLRDAANILLRAGWASHCDALVDLDTDPSTPSVGANSSAPDGGSPNLTIFQSDGIHLNTQGYTQVAALVSPVLAAMCQTTSSTLAMKKKATATFGDPGVWYAAVNRLAGRGFAFTAEIPAYQAGLATYLGWGAAASGNPVRGTIAFYAGGPEIAIYDDGSASRKIGYYTTDTRYQIAIFPRQAAAGAYYFIKGGIYTKWTLIWIGIIDSTNPLYPALTSYATYMMACKYAEVFDAGQLLAPLASDNFTGARTRLGSTDGVGHLTTAGFDNGGAGLAWIAPTWNIGSAYANNADMALGSELATGALEVGKWYKVTATETDHFYTGSAVNDTFVAEAATALDASNKVRELLLYGSGAYLDLGTPDINIYMTSVNAAQTCSGVDLSVDSPSNPQTFIRVYNSRRTGKCYVDKYVAGVRTNVIAGVTATYSNPFRIQKFGTHLIVHQGYTLIGHYTITDAALLSNTIHGMFLTSTGNSIKPFVAHAIQGGHDTILDRFCGASAGPSSGGWFHNWFNPSVF
jgi:hypothetical protein